MFWNQTLVDICLNKDRWMILFRAPVIQDPHDAKDPKPSGQVPGQ